MSATESTLVQLRQAFDRARTAKPAAVLERVSAVADNVPQFVRDLRGAEAASTIVGQSATARRERGETRRPGDFLIPVGTAMSAITDMEISSDWEGHWRALITRDVYDLSQDYILIPKGTRVLGTALKAKPVNEAINQRMAIAAQWLVLPNGARIDLSRSNMLDAAGVGAIPGDVDHHFLAMAGGVAAYGVIGGLGAAAASRAVGGTTQVTTASEAVALAPGYAAAAEIAKGLTDIGRNVASRYLNLVPTVTVKPGTAMVIFLDDEMYMPAWAPIDEFAPALPARAQN